MLVAVVDLRACAKSGDDGAIGGRVGLSRARRASSHELGGLGDECYLRLLFCSTRTPRCPFPSARRVTSLRRQAHPPCAEAALAAVHECACLGCVRSRAFQAQASRHAGGRVPPSVPQVTAPYSAVGRYHAAAITHPSHREERYKRQVHSSARALDALTQSRICWLCRLSASPPAAVAQVAQRQRGLTVTPATSAESQTHRYMCADRAAHGQRARVGQNMRFYRVRQSLLAEALMPARRFPAMFGPLSTQAAMSSFPGPRE